MAFYFTWFGRIEGIIDEDFIGWTNNIILETGIEKNKGLQHETVIYMIRDLHKCINET